MGVTLRVEANGLSARRPEPERVVVVVEESGRLSPRLARACEFLELRLVRVASEQALTDLLAETLPAAVVSEVDMRDQDGFNVMRVVAAHDRHLPFLLVVDDPVLLGAADAVQEAWGMTGVRIRGGAPSSAQLIGFLATVAAPAPRQPQKVRTPRLVHVRPDSPTSCAAAP